MDSSLKALLRYICLGLLASSIVLACDLICPQIFNDWELKTFDYRMKARGEILTSPYITLIDIDDNSIGDIGRWPWDRSLHAKMIETLSLYGAHTIAVCLNGEGRGEARLAEYQRGLAETLGIPVIRPLEEGVAGLLRAVRGVVL